MTAGDPYNPEVRRRFENPVHAGDLADDYDQVLVATASEPHDGARILLYAGLNGGKIAALRFRAKGCPHFIAAADWLCSQFEGSEPARLGQVRANELFAGLDVPVTKTGRMLLIEDAAKALVASGIDGTPGH